MNNISTTGGLTELKLDDKVINIFHSLNINVNKYDIEDCYRLRGRSEEHNCINCWS